ncbi:TraB/GumN family protein [Desulfonatronospira sp.]|uniref:TraB/GumN family protein n=1 Tax=Desulfonatronospira sp. TaxID=1962951 RepID=UPI0025C5936B|nr:TraB/GumN family protein [Desulfonatronospira sp.]
MSEQPLLELDNLHQVQAGEKTVYLLGTAHVSEKSVEDVKKAVQQVQPDTICVELCASRYQTLMHPDVWKNTDIYQVIKENKALFLLAQLGLSAFYRRIGQKLGVRPGAEMLEGVKQAESTGAELVLADRDVNITLKRVWGSLSMWGKFKLLMQLLAGMALPGDIKKEDIEKLKDKDQLQVVMDEFSRSFPQIQKSLIDERDQYLAHKIANSPGSSILVIVGAGHIPGIKNYLDKDIDTGPLTAKPAKAIWPSLVKWGIPLVIVGLLVLGFVTQGAQHSVQSIYIWILVNGFCSALAVSLALAHPFTIMAAFVAAPITSLNPTMAAGWIAGLVQAWVKKPLVADLENLPKAFTSIKAFWKNPVCRILLVVVLANQGSVLGTFVAGTWIFTRVV